MCMLSKWILETRIYAISYESDYTRIWNEEIPKIDNEEKIIGDEKPKENVSSSNSEDQQEQVFQEEDIIQDNETEEHNKEDQQQTPSEEDIKVESKDSKDKDNQPTYTDSNNKEDDIIQEKIIIPSSNEQEERNIQPSLEKEGNVPLNETSHIELKETISNEEQIPNEESKEQTNKAEDDHIQIDSPKEKDNIETIP